MATLSNTEILQLTIDAFKVRFPMLLGQGGFGTDLSSERARKGDQVIAHIRTLPSTQSYDGTNGYEANAASASSLLVDVPVTMDQHTHVPVSVDHLDQLASKKNLLQGAIGDMAYVLGKAIVDYALAKVTAANFSYASDALALANVDKSTLNAVTLKLNANGANPTGRFGIINSPLYNKLEEDARLSSKDYAGQARAGYGYGRLQNVCGFQDIYEYPDLPSNSENLAGFFGVSPCIAVATRVPKDPLTIAQAAGIPVPAKFDVVTDPESGLSLLGIQWVKQGTFDIWLTVAILYGATGGKNAGSAGTIMDKGGYRVVAS
jgi:hypothetical protein